MRTLCLSLVALCLFSAPAYAQPAQLFQRMPAPADGMAPQHAGMLDNQVAEPHIQDAVLGTVDLEALDAPALSFSSPWSEQTVFERREVTYRTSDDYSWLGEGSDGRSFALFVVRDGALTGSIRADGQTMSINPHSGGLHVLSAIDVAALTDHPPDWQEFQQDLRDEAVIPAPPEAWPGYRYRQQMNGGPPVITVIAAYTAAALAGLPDIESLIQLSIDEANYTLLLSGVHHRFSLVHTYQTNTSEDGESISTNLHRFRGFEDDHENHYPEIHGLRDDFLADLAMLVGVFPGGCGIGYQWAQNPAFAFSAVGTNCIIGSFTVAHEFGHNLGAQHNPEQNENTHFDYGHGYVNTAGQWRTVMAYEIANVCPATAIDRCSRIPYWSSPGVFFNGVATGDATQRDNVRVLNENAGTIAGHRPPTGGPVASANVSEITTSLHAGAATQVPIDITNTGEAHLHWEASISTSLLAPPNAIAKTGASASGLAEEALSAPDAFGYTWIHPHSPLAPAFDFIDLEVVGTQIPRTEFSTNCFRGHLREGIAPLELPFDFPFYGALHSTVRVSVNGYLTFGTFNGCANLNTDPIPTPDEPNSLIAPMWMNLMFGTDEQDGAIYTYDPEDGRFFVQWNLRREVSGVETGPVRVFQVILYETGDIRFQYSSPIDILLTGSTVHQNSVGIESPDGTDGLRINHGNESWRRIKAGHAIHISPPTPWVLVGPASGDAAVNDISSLTVTLDASELEAGEYTAGVRIRTNEGHDALMVIPVNLTVTPAAAITGDPGWRMLSSPIENATYGSLLENVWTQGFPGANTQNGVSNVRIYALDAETNNWPSVASANDAILEGRGFIAFVYEDDAPGEPGEFPKTLSPEGPARSGTVTFTNLHGSGTLDGWNLLGNPYAQTIDWGGAGWTGQDDFDQGLYIWDPALPNYRVWDGDEWLPQTGAPEGGLIAPFQGFFVRANVAEPALAVDEDAKDSGGPFFGKQEPMVASIDFELKKDELRSFARIRFSDHGEVGKDRYDAYRLSPLTGRFIAVYSVIEGGDALSINSLPISLGEPITVPLAAGGYDNGDPIAGSYTLTWPRMANLPDAWSFILTDTATDERLDLREAISYTFALDAAHMKMSTSAGADDPASSLVLDAEAFDARFILAIDPTGAVSTDEIATLPATFALHAAYPNPFNPATQIAYDVPEHTFVRVAVYDAVGRQVAVLAAHEHAAGEHRLTWNAAGMASGLYFVRMETAGRVMTRSVTLLR